MILHLRSRFCPAPPAYANRPKSLPSTPKVVGASSKAHLTPVCPSNPTLSRVNPCIACSIVEIALTCLPSLLPSVLVFPGMISCPNPMDASGLLDAGYCQLSHLAEVSGGLH